MRLNNFEIHSYRSCIKTDVPLHRDLTALIGVNGAGKSNILNAILLLKKVFHSRYGAIREKDSSYNICHITATIQHEKKALHMKGKVIFGTDERNIDDIRYAKLQWNLKEFFRDIPDWVDIPIQHFSFQDDFRFFEGNVAHHFFHQEHFNVERRPKISYKISKQKLMLVNEQYKFYRKAYPLLSKVVSFFDRINYYSASQFSDPSRCPVSIELEEERSWRRTLGYVWHQKFMLDLYKSWKAQDAQYKRYLNTVNKSGIGLVDDIRFEEFEMPSSSYEVLSGGKIKKIEKNRSLVIPSFLIEGSPLSPNQLSEGTFKTLALLFYVLTVESNLLLIEEPEVCIHHGLLNSIISIIKSQSKYKQIIISTHSDFVLDYLKPENLVLVKREFKRGTTAKLLTKALSKNDFKALRLYLEESGSLGEYWKEGGLENG